MQRTKAIARSYVSLYSQGLQGLQGLQLQYEILKS